MRLLLTAAILTAFASPAAAFDTMEKLGEALFFDVNLSKSRTQSCATCHDPEFAFVDPRETDAGRAVSLGDDGESLGDRSAPTAGYAMFTPDFEQLDTAAWRGGMFWDGRAAGLAGQAGGPPLNPIEMGMPDKASVVERLKEDDVYIAAFKALFGDDVWASDERVYDAMTQAIASFETTPLFAPFDSKYDRYLRGQVELTSEEELGRVLFTSQQFTSCNLCHQLRTSPIAADETFTNYEYHNIGTPVNAEVRGVNGVEGPDVGLKANPAVNAAEAAGRFKVPTLRNVAVTGPYMHNGVFKDLRTVVLFYNKYNTTNPKRQINPETGQPWAMPEIPQNLSVTELTEGPALDDRRIDALVAFMKTLTDQRYEHLLED
ncbi:Cytochrome c peroxidase [Aliiroseovarius halocynthiae]|uniref:Methylamine utilization protein MauG n=1 Tax=Aliiroseovarius halocynthiae TaxID=985055 RepID=A0A545SRN6_9RHOB|nr:cytochrome c peroxidase [Aliiroseovarius halocynthiae]TQV67633.1 methylamine utilization protein MauG [Aliiroseovarius halocynthiae]SMR81673.1 Cytochrome c peroxidase [Aliiroseovarius halocynthiae]